ncbi:unnamed protein product (mitochondrion) [Plasmodiophora brassicae]|uniref:Branchpoint-bridging protein n=1 Tax=Plasmodiophora brassicae TaxID=37360 RepID=A0A3P3YCF8_PLABS|nr:unnamed protein product [Plasmodiophora brassicae]
MTDPVEVSAPNSDDATARANGESSSAAGNDEEQRKPKRSRWGSASDVVEPKKRRSRWGSEVDKVPLTPEMAAATAAMSETQREVYLLRLRMQDITAKLANIKALIPNDPTLLSPSPPPEYDTHGKRTNTREQRIRDRLVKERNELIERSIKLNPQFAAPADFKKQRFVAKLMIPQDQPMTEDGQFSRPHSYCGMILGPRGLTQKRMQKETNCKIEIRGRGSQKEGRRHKPHPSDNEDLHVLITAENEADLSLCLERRARLHCQRFSDKSNFVSAAMPRDTRSRSLHEIKTGVWRVAGKQCLPKMIDRTKTVWRGHVKVKEGLELELHIPV